MTEYLIRSGELQTDGATALQNCVHCNATDGLGITSSDLDQIIPDWKDRHSNTFEGYMEVDLNLINYICTKTDYDGPIATRLRRTEFKRENPYNFVRSLITKNIM